MQMKLTRRIQVFLLYAHRDQETVRRLYRRLVREGANVWLDTEKLLPGQDWVYEITRAIHSSDVVIACLSARFNQQGGYRHEELKIAVARAGSTEEREIFIIPACLEPCDLPLTLRQWQRVDLFEAGGFKKLINALHEQVALE
jgi:hypothetical protein